MKRNKMKSIETEAAAQKCLFLVEIFEFDHSTQRAPTNIE